MSWRLSWLRLYPPTKGPFTLSGPLNQQRVGAPATGPWGQAMQAMAHTPGRVANAPVPLTYPKGEVDMVGLVGTEALAAATLIYPKGYYGTTPSTLQPLVQGSAPWETPTNEIPGGGQGVGF